MASSNSGDLFLNPKVNQYGSHMVMTNVHKETKHRYINIDTRFCDYIYTNTNHYTNVNANGNTVSQSGQLLANYNFTLPDRITNVFSLSVENLELPLFINNISNSKQNNIFVITKASVPTVVSNICIPDGFYDNNVNSIVSKIATLLPNTDLAFTITGQNYVKITNNSLVSYTINFNSNGYVQPNTLNTLGSFLGFINPFYTIIAGASITAEHPFFYLPKYLYLVIDESVNGNQNSFISPLPKSIISKNIIAKILFLNGYSQGSFISTNIHIGSLLSDKRTYSGGGIDIQKINIKLIDEFGNVVSNNGIDFSFCIRIDYQ